METDERPRRPRRAAWLLAGVLALALSGVRFDAGLPGTAFDPAGWREADGMVGQGWSRGPLRDNRPFLAIEDAGPPLRLRTARIGR